MAIRNRKSDKVTFGYFRNESKAQDYIEHYKKFRMKKGTDPKFFVVKRDRNKAGQKTYEAYCLIPR
jgi:hypothetical protein